MSFARIFLPTDFSPHSDRAVEVALELARPLGSRVHVFHCFQILLGGGAPLGSAGIDPKLQEDAEARVQAAARRFEEAGVAVETQVVAWPYPSEAILKATAEFQPDLIVMGTRGASGLQHVLLGSVTERIVREASCPVLTAKAR